MLSSCACLTRGEIGFWLQEWRDSKHWKLRSGPASESNLFGILNGKRMNANVVLRRARADGVIAEEEHNFVFLQGYIMLQDEFSDMVSRQSCKYAQSG